MAEFPHKMHNRHSWLSVPAAIVLLMLFSTNVSAAMVSQTIFFNITGFFQTLGLPSATPTTTVSGEFAFTYDDSLISVQQDSFANLPSVTVDAINLTINNAINPAAAESYDLGEVVISLRVDTDTLILSDSLGPTHGADFGTNGFGFTFINFSDFANVDYLFGNYTVESNDGLWFSATGSASAVAGNQVSAVPLPPMLWGFIAGLGYLASRRPRENGSRA